MPNNIVCIIADDHRASAMGRCGSEPVMTPHLDALAVRGCHLQQLRIEGGRCRAVCIPTRASLITGCSVKTACEDLEGRTLKVDAPMLPARLRDKGYHCEVIGKWHQDLPSLRRGFDHGQMIFTAGMGDHHSLPVYNWNAFSMDRLPPPYKLKKYSSEAYADAAVDFLRKRALQSSQPFYLQVGLTLPHDPFDPPPGWEEPPDDKLPPLPPGFQSRHPFEIGDIEVRDEQLLPWPRSTVEVRKMAARYYAMIHAIDRLVGRVQSALEETGLVENTIFIYTGDHGLCGGRHGLLGKQNVYEAALRIPGILAGPGIPAGVLVDALSSQLDLAPTLLDLVGLAEYGDGMEGKTLRPEIEGSPDIGSRKFHFARYRHYQRAITDGHFKLIATRMDETLRLQLFDLADDPEETRDLVAGVAQLSCISDLVHALNEHLDRGNDPDFARIEEPDVRVCLDGRKS